MSHDLDDDRPRRQRACPDCGRSFCVCDDATNRWLREQKDAGAIAADVSLPDEIDTARVKGGHLEDRERGGAHQQLAELARAQGVRVQRAGSSGQIVEAAPPAGHPLRHHRDVIAARLAWLDKTAAEVAAEKERRALQEKALALRFGGEGMSVEEVGAALGHGRQWASGLFAEIQAEAVSPGAYSAAHPPRCEWCREAFVPRRADPDATTKRGRPRRFCSDAHADAFRSAKRYANNKSRIAVIFRDNSVTTQNSAAAV